MSEFVGNDVREDHTDRDLALGDRVGYSKVEHLRPVT
jgi:hypothetical protein